MPAVMNTAACASGAGAAKANPARRAPPSATFQPNLRTARFQSIDLPLPAPETCCLQFRAVLDAGPAPAGTMLQSFRHKLLPEVAHRAITVWAGPCSPLVP